MKGILWLTASVQENPLSKNVFQNPPNHFHVTLQFNVELTEEIQKLLGETVEATIVANCYDDRIQALSIALPEDVRAMCHNAVPHMTVSMADGVKPVESNAMLAKEHFSEVVNVPITLKYDFFSFL